MLVIAYAEFNIEQAVMEWIGENTNHSTHLIPQGESVLIDWIRRVSIFMAT